MYPTALPTMSESDLRDALHSFLWNGSLVYIDPDRPAPERQTLCLNNHDRECSVDTPVYQTRQDVAEFSLIMDRNVITSTEQLHTLLRDFLEVKYTDVVNQVLERIPCTQTTDVSRFAVLIKDWDTVRYEAQVSQPQDASDVEDHDQTEHTNPVVPIDCLYAKIAILYYACS